MEDDLLGKPVKLFHYKQAIPDVDLAPDEWLVDKITAHRQNADGDWEFAVKWQDSEQSTWEPLGHFFHKYAEDFVKYGQDNNLRPDVIEHLLRHPAEVAVLRRDPVKVQVVRAIQEALYEGPPRGARHGGRVWEPPPDDWPAEVEDPVMTSRMDAETALEEVQASTTWRPEAAVPRAQGRVATANVEAISELQKRQLQQFHGQAVRPLPGAEGNPILMRLPDDVAGGTVGPPGASTVDGPPELEKNTVTHVSQQQWSPTPTSNKAEISVLVPHVPKSQSEACGGTPFPS